MSYVIESSVPPPACNARTPVTKAMESLEVGQSFHIADEYAQLQARANLSRRRPKRYSIRRDGSGWRCWRLE